MKRSLHFILSTENTFVDCRTGLVVDTLPPDEILFSFSPSPCPNVPTLAQRPDGYVDALRKQREFNIKQVLERNTKKPRTVKAASTKKSKPKKLTSTQSSAVAAMSELPDYLKQMMLKQMK